MKKTTAFPYTLLASLLLTPVLWFGSVATAAESARTSLTGSWSGSFQVGNYPPLQLVFHIEREESGTLSARLDIPSQYRTGIPAEHISLDGRRLVMQFPVVQAEFLGSVSMADDSESVQRISGDWSQSGEFVALTLQRHATDD